MPARKPKPVVFDPFSLAKGVFWHAVPASEDTDQIQEPAADKNPEVPVASNPVTPAKTFPPSLRTVFGELVQREYTRTRFERRRIEACLPPELKRLFSQVGSIGAKIPIDDTAKKLLDYVEKNIYGILPDYESFAREEQKDGFVINGEERKINMCQKAAARQMDEITTTISKTTLIKEATIRLKKDFSPQDIRDAVHSSGFHAMDRKLIAQLVFVANQIK